MGLLERLLDEARHHEVTPELYVLAEIQALPRRPEPELDGFARLAGQRAPEGPALADVGAHGRIAVGLDAVRQVIEGGRVLNLARDETSREIGDLVRQAPPDAAGLVLGSVRRRGDLVPLND